MLERGSLGNSFGNRFKLTSFGESHGEAIGCVIEGCPPGIPLSKEDIQHFLDQRKPGGAKKDSSISPRNESDQVEILSGVYEGKTLGTPIALITKNKDQRPSDYKNESYPDFKYIFRPSHADFTHWIRFKGHIDPRGGGRASARETWARVAAGAVALKVIKHSFCKDIKIRVEIDDEKKWERRLKRALKNGDTLGGVLKVNISGLPAGLGEPVFHRFDAALAYAMLSIPACRAFEMGEGFKSCIEGTGKTQNDQMKYNSKKKKIEFLSNNSAGLLGGISRGDDVIFKVGFKPISSLVGHPQNTVGVTHDGQLKNIPDYILKKGRHDVSALKRAIPVVESMCYLVLLDLFV